MGIEFIVFGIYYVEFVDYYEVSFASVGLIFTIRALSSSVFGKLIPHLE